MKFREQKERFPILSEGQIDDKVLTSVDDKDVKKDDASKINDEEDHG